MSPSADIQTRLRALTPLQRAMLARRLDAEALERPPATAPSQLIAYVVARTETAPAVDDVRDFLRTRVPDFMVPSVVRVLDELPRMPNGKVDRRALPAPGPAEAAVATFTRPRNPVEQRLTAIWSAVLGTDQIGIDDNFFEIGGDSISSIQIIARANDQGLKLASSEFFEHPTVRRLARAIEQRASLQRGSYLVPLAPEGTRTPLFVIHGWGGKLFKYRALAHALGDDQPVYGIQDVEHEDPNERFPTFESMAERYAEEIRAVRPHGPYLLLGFSLGAAIAFVIATHFRRAGEEIEQLFVLENVPFNMPRTVHFRVMKPFLQQRARHHLRSFVRKPSEAVGHLRRLMRTFQREFGAPPLPTDPPHSEPVDAASGDDFYRTLMRSYVPQPCPMPVTLIESTQAPYDFLPAWRYLAGDTITTFRVEADEHDAILFEATENGVANIVRDQLDRTHRGRANRVV